MGPALVFFFLSKMANVQDSSVRRVGFHCMLSLFPRHIHASQVSTL